MFLPPASTSIIREAKNCAAILFDDRALAESPAGANWSQRSAHVYAMCMCICVWWKEVGADNDQLHTNVALLCVYAADRETSRGPSFQDDFLEYFVLFLSLLVSSLSFRIRARQPAGITPRGRGARGRARARKPCALVSQRNHLVKYEDARRGESSL